MLASVLTLLSSFPLVYMHTECNKNCHELELMGVIKISSYFIHCTWNSRLAFLTEVQLIIIFLQVGNLAICCKMCLYCDVTPYCWELQSSCEVFLGGLFWGFVDSGGVWIFTHPSRALYSICPVILALSD